MSPTLPPSEHPRAASIEAATGIALSEWTRRIDEAGGRDLDHAAIARLLPQRWDVTEWWAQNVTVAYEQVIGRRVIGQSCEGDFSASASRTLTGDPDAVVARWDAFMTAPRREQLGLGEPSLSATARWRYWRAPLTDGSRLSVNIAAKDDRRSTLGIEHKGIESAEGREVWKTAWTRTLTDFTAVDEENR
ncbi:hypothetical protein [Brachybacterium sp. UNK5269]|uniref:hypothetical protein n=1 Tax=Brachybacterium sp. UNK5269 TaxID=3408576 RepID=UPI003BAEBCD7